MAILILTPTSYLIANEQTQLSIIIVILYMLGIVFTSIGYFTDINKFEHKSDNIITKILFKFILEIISFD